MKILSQIVKPYFEITDETREDIIPQYPLQEGFRLPQFKTINLNQMKTNFTSSHICTGQKDKWKIQSCHYKNLCFINNTWSYIQNDEQNRTDLDANLTPLGITMPGNANNLKFSPKVISNQQLPSNFTYLDGKYVIYTSYNTENFGHFLGDELLPIFNLLDIFGAYEYDVHLLHSNIFRPYNCYSQKNSKHKCEHFYKTLTPLLLKNPVLDVDYFVTLPVFQNKVCFENVYVGLGYLSDHCEDTTVHKGQTNCNIHRAPLVYKFRNILIKNAAIENSDELFIVLWDRKKKRELHHLDKIYQMLENDYSAEFKIFYVNDWKDYSIKEQISIMSKCVLYITSIGGGSFGTLFQPRGATTIKLHYNGPLDEHFFNFMGYVQLENIYTINGDYDINLVISKIPEAIQRFQMYHS